MSTDGRVLRPATRSSPELSARLRRPAQHGARPGQIVLATSIVALMMALLISMTIARQLISDYVESPLAEKLAGTDRVAYYVIPEELFNAPSFRIGPSDVSLKLITHVELPAGHEFGADEDFAYGIRLTLESLDGEPQWTHEVNIRTRQSKSGHDRFGWRHENAFLLDDSGTGRRPRELTDDRLTRVRLPEGVGDRRLRLTFLPREPSADVRGLARVYVRHERPVDERTLRELSLAPETAAELVDHLTYRDWDQLSEDERRQKLGHVWTRMSAEGLAGVDYEILSIYENGFRLPRGTKTDQRRLTVNDAHSLAINVLGPAELSLEVFGDVEHFAGLSVKRRGLDWLGGTGGRDVPFGRSRVALRSLSVPEGVHTLIFESEHELELALEVAESRADDARVWLCEADRPRRTDEEGNEVLEPDVRRIQTVHLGQQWQVLPRWAIEGPDDVATRMFRFDVRVVHPSPMAWSWREPNWGPEPELDLCFFDHAGEQLECEPWTGRRPAQSHFEGVMIADESGGAGLIESRWYAVSEPQTWRVIAPVGAAGFELRARAGIPGLLEVPEQRLIVRAYGYWPEVETVVGLPFREHQTEHTIWRYPPLDTRTWFPLRPVNYDELQDDSAIADLLAQVRLQPRGYGSGEGDGSGGGRRDPGDRLANERAGQDGFDPGPWVTLEPRGVHRRRSILEELDAQAGRRLADRWDPSLFTELWPDRNMIIDFSATGPGAPQLHWQVAPNTLGRSVMLEIGDKKYEHTVAETRGRWKLPIESGRRDVELEFDAVNSEYEIWIDRPVLVASPPVSRRRVVHELTNSLVFPLRKPDQEALTVNIVVYVPRRRERAELAVSIDDGRPQRRTGVPIEHLSIVDRSYSIDPGGAFDEQDRLVDARERIRFVDLEGSNKLPLDVMTVQITLGEDIVPGVHEVRVDLLDGDRVWVRAFHRGVADRSKPAASWTETTKRAGEVKP
ncbi:hypothetical protein [Enhygromyxa salina]|uniref:hypothetical protein n=1 Tax=Enhygromyxa salina TaxID=215803 RepID=UPI000695F418|nr:hypothetical protein [Enhygromyxa salina]